MFPVFVESWYWIKVIDFLVQNANQSKIDQCIHNKPRIEHQYVDLLIRHFNWLNIYVLCFPQFAAPETREALKKVLDSVMSKSGKLRSLARDLSRNYTDDAAKSFLWLQSCGICSCPQKGFLLLVMEVLMKGSAGMIVDASTYIYSLQPSSYNILVEYG